MIAKVFKLNPALIKKTSLDESSLFAKRGKNLSLNVERVEMEINKKMPFIKEGILKMKKLKEDNYINELQSY